MDMKKTFKNFLVGFVWILTPLNCYSQEIDDVSQYLYKEGMVVDTALAKDMADKIRQKRKLEIKENNQEIYARIELLKKIADTEQNKVKSEEDKLRLKNITQKYSNTIEKQILKRRNNGILAGYYEKQGMNRHASMDHIVSAIDKGKIHKDFLASIDPILSVLSTELKDEDKYDKVPFSELVHPLPMKSGIIKVLNPNNRAYLYVHSGYKWKEQIDELDYKKQLIGWEWWATKDYEKKYTAYPTTLHYRQYSSHPQYMVVDNRVFDKEGNLIAQTTLLRSNEQILKGLKEQMLKEIYIKDYKDNKYDILKASVEIQERVKRRLGLPSQTVDSKKAEKNRKIIADYYEKKEVARRSRGTNKQAQAEKEAEQAALKSGLLFLEAMMDKNSNAANEFVDQLKEDHRNDLYTIYEIARVNEKAFKVIFLNKDDKSSYTGLITVEQTGMFKCQYKYELIPNDKNIAINKADYQ